MNSRSWLKLVAPVALAATLVLMVVFHVDRNAVESDQNVVKYKQLDDREQSALKTNDTLKTILMWNSYFGYPNYGYGNDSGQELFIKANCPINSCIMMKKTGLIPVEDYDAIIFHTYDWKTFPLHNRSNIPLRRKPSQRYIYFLMEPPGNIKSNMKSLTNFFNWTITYRWDSDIPRLYGCIIPIGSSGITPPNRHPDWLNPDLDYKDSSKLKLTGQKTKLIAWFASNCDTFSKREYYVKELSKYIPVDVYGKCGTYSCPRSEADKCQTMLNANYKFYLSLENSLCRDYVTEKLFGVMEHDVIPVVYGAANYSNHVPPMSYINIFDFRSARELAEYLAFLDQNPHEFVKYFWWKQHYKVFRSHTYSLCKLCEMLHQQQKPKSYPDIYEWWSGSNMCLKPHVG